MKLWHVGEDNLLQAKPRTFIGQLSVVALASVMLVSACGDSDKDAQPSSSDAAEAMPSGTTETPSLDAGEVIVFERAAPGAENPDLYAVGADGGEPWLLRTASGRPHWSPDGNMLAFGACLNPPDCDTIVALLDRSTGEVRGLSAPDPALEMHCGSAWTPDGERLACESFGFDDPERNGIYTIRASDGKGLTRITTNPDGDDIPLAFSPDGGQLLFARTDPARDEPANQALFVASLSGGQPQRITTWGYTDDHGGWSPDGQSIVFETNGSLYRLAPDGQGLAEIALKMPDGSSPDGAYDVSFSPDGARILFSVSGPEPGLYTARPDGSDVQLLTASPTEDHHANWAAAPR